MDKLPLSQYAPGLARDGFIAIRAALKRGKPDIALDIAEALHNMPDEGNYFQKELTMAALRELLERYPDEPIVQQLNSWAEY